MIAASLSRRRAEQLQQAGAAALPTATARQYASSQEQQQSRGRTAAALAAAPPRSPLPLAEAAWAAPPSRATATAVVRQEVVEESALAQLLSVHSSNFLRLQAECEVAVARMSEAHSSERATAVSHYAEQRAMLGEDFEGRVRRARDDSFGQDLVFQLAAVTRDGESERCALLESQAAALAAADAEHVAAVERQSACTRQVLVDEETHRECVLLYERRCSELRTPVCTAFCRQLADEYVQLSNAGLGPRGCDALCAVIVKAARTRNLELQNNRLGCEGARALAGALAAGAVLVALDLASNHIKSAGGAAIFDALDGGVDGGRGGERGGGGGGAGGERGAGGALRILSLRGNELGDDIAGALARGFSTFRLCSLTHLDLSDNLIGPPAAAELGKALSLPHTALASLNLRWNRLGAEGAAAIFAGLRSNTSLTHIDVSFCSLTDEGGHAFARCLLVNKRLQTALLCHNRLGSEAAVAIATSAARHPALSELGVVGNDLGDAGAQAFSALAKSGVRVDGPAGADQVMASRLDSPSGLLAPVLIMHVLCTGSSVQTISGGCAVSRGASAAVLASPMMRAFERSLAFGLGLDLPPADLTPVGAADEDTEREKLAVVMARVTIQFSSDESCGVATVDPTASRSCETDFPQIMLPQGAEMGSSWRVQVARVTAPHASGLFGGPTGALRAHTAVLTYRRTLPPADGVVGAAASSLATSDSSRPGSPAGRGGREVSPALAELTFRVPSSSLTSPADFLAQGSVHIPVACLPAAPIGSSMRFSFLRTKRERDPAGRAIQ